MTEQLTPDDVTVGGETAVDALRDAIPDRMAKDTSNFFVEYGVREDDMAMVLHFYRSKEHALAILEGGHVQGTLWDDDYAVTHRLERGIEKHFDVNQVAATYDEKLDNFCIIIAGLGKSMDPWPLVEAFISGIDDVLVS